MQKSVKIGQKIIFNKNKKLLNFVHTMTFFGKGIWLKHLKLIIKSDNFLLNKVLLQKGSTNKKIVKQKKL